MKLNKALGQNFFNNPNLADWIVDTALTTLPATILEIGPGDGYFTSRFAQKVKNVAAIEKDQELSDFLSVKIPNLHLYTQDVLDYDIRELDGIEKPLVVYGSLPYNISKKIIAKFIQCPDINDFYFIIQKEVAEKYAVSDRDSSLLSITASIFVDTKILKILKPGNFIPAPKVDSAFIHMTRNRNIEKITNLRGFEIFVKTAFTNPRKTLRNNLKPLVNGREFSLSNSEILSTRPEDLDFDSYVTLYGQLML